MRNIVKKQTGITLIALVVTIIVLIILAGVSINMLVGENGIINMAQRAKEETDQAEEDELRRLTQAEAATHLENTTHTDSSTGKEVIIPAGFAVSQVEGENTIEDGLVIIDKEGNEYVWVSCTEEEYKEADEGWIKSQYEDKTWVDEQSTTIGLTSIRKYGGFYIGRYEAGIPENAIEIYSNSNGAIYNRVDRNNLEIINKYIPVSKRNMPVWNWIDQTNAQILAEKVIDNNTIKSYLIDSYAWNAVCRKIEKRYGDKKDITNSSNWGNYFNNTTTQYEKIDTLYAIHQYINGWQYATEYKRGMITGAPKGEGSNQLELASGASNDFKALNIYDLAGNMWEWTTESSGNYRVLRGGGFPVNGDENPVVAQGGNGTIGSRNFAFGFRVVLYLK